MTTETTAQDGKQVVKADRKTTEYVVLARADESGEGIWTQVGSATYTAASASEALKVAAKLHETQHGVTYDEWVAVPARSWKPMSRKVEQVTKESWTS